MSMYGLSFCISAGKLEDTKHPQNSHHAAAAASAAVAGLELEHIITNIRLQNNTGAEACDVKPAEYGQVCCGDGSRLKTTTQPAKNDVSDGLPYKQT